MDTNENDLINEMNELNANNKKSNNKKVIIIASVIAFILVIAIVLGISGIFKSKGEKFVELLTKDQYVVEMIKDRNEDLSKDSETSYTLTLKKKFLSLTDSTFTLLGNDLILNANVIKEGKNFDSSASLKLGTLELQSMELIRENNTFALSVPNLFSYYIAFDDKNAEDVAEKLGFIPSTESEDVDFDLLKALNKYSKVLVRAINNYIEIEDNVSVNVNNKNLVTKQYTLSLDERKLNIVALELLGKLKDDADTINFVVKYVQENENLTEDEKAMFTYENLKAEIVNLYNQVLEIINTTSDGESILEIKINVLDGKSIKTTINIATEETTEIIIASTSDEENDYMLLALNMYGSTLNAEYNGRKTENGYKGEVILNADDASISAIDLNIEKVAESKATVRSINELNPLFLNEATDAELEALRREIEVNLGIEEEDNGLEELVFGEGDFKLDNPDARLKLLDVSRNTYNQINFGMTKEDVIKILGEPDEVFEVIGLENNGWYYDENKSIYFMSVEYNDGKVSAVYNDIASSMKNNIQISTELETEIVNLSNVMSEVYIGMSKDETIEILGDKYLEIAKTSLGYTMIKWYDKNENRVIIEFDSENKISYIDPISIDM